MALLPPELVRCILHSVPEIRFSLRVVTFAVTRDLTRQRRLLPRIRERNFIRAFVQSASSSKLQ
jgi:hypothetical protein